MKNPVHQITLSGFFIGLGILIPILFHSAGLGKVFLPMFWSVAACGFFLSVPYAAATGTLTPLLSLLMTGMPPPPIIYKMIFELTFLSVTISFLYRKTLIGIFWIILAGLIVSEIILFFSAAAIAPILGLPPQFYAIGSLIRGIPGIVIILILVPLIIKKIKNESLFKSRSDRVSETSYIF